MLESHVNHTRKQPQGVATGIMQGCINNPILDPIFACKPLMAAQSKAATGCCDINHARLKSESFSTQNAISVVFIVLYDFQTTWTARHDMWA